MTSTSPSVLSAALVVVLTLSSWAWALPQAWRTHRRGTAGVSPAGWAAVAAKGTVAMTYGLVHGDPAQLTACSVPTIAALWLVARCWTTTDARARARTAATLAAALGLGIVSVVSEAGLLSSVVLVAVSTISAVPHAVTALRSSDLSGVAPNAWAASAASSVAWTVHGVLGGYGAVVVANVVWVLVSLLVLGAACRHVPSQATAAVATPASA